MEMSKFILKDGTIRDEVWLNKNLITFQRKHIKVYSLFDVLGLQDIHKI